MILYTYFPYNSASSGSTELFHLWWNLTDRRANSSKFNQRTIYIGIWTKHQCLYCCLSVIAITRWKYLSWAILEAPDNMITKRSDIYKYIYIKTKKHLNLENTIFKLSVHRLIQSISCGDFLKSHNFHQHDFRWRHSYISFEPETISSFYQNTVPKTDGSLGTTFIRIMRANYDPLCLLKRQIEVSLGMTIVTSNKF